MADSTVSDEIPQASGSKPENRRHQMLVVAGALLVVLVSLWQFSNDKRTTRFHPDESRWINRAQYLTELRHPLSSFWADAYLIRGQPPMGSYLTGLGLFLQGHDLEGTGPWDFHYGNDSDINWNVTYGNMPTASDLLAARNAAIAVGILTSLLVYLIVTQLTNWIGGVVAGVFMGVHPLSVYLSTLAVSDAVFTTVVALSVLVAIWLAKRPAWGRAIVLGIVFGVGSSLKLSPMFVAAGLAGVGALIVAWPIARRIRPARWLWSWLGAEAASIRRLGWMLIALPMIAVTVFLVSYPYLWPDPVGRTRVLFEFRRAEMKNQARIWEDAAINSRPEAIRRTWDMLETRYSASGKFLVKSGLAERREGDPNGAEPGYDLPFAIAGLVAFGVTALRRGFRSPHLLAFLTLMGQSGIILGGLSVDFDRYYLPFVLMFAIGLGVGIGEGVTWLSHLRARLPQAVRTGRYAEARRASAG
jgi:4-amino-4-deoxy-L-arabinose transferase-like glycosyltransferase